MTVSLLVLYTAPDDPVAFDEHYLGTHGPLVDSLPGLQSWSSGRVVAAADGQEQSWYRVAQLVFPDQATLQAAMGSDEGKATAADFGRIAPPGSRMFVVAADQ